MDSEAKVFIIRKSKPWSGVAKIKERTSCQASQIKFVLMRFRLTAEIDEPRVLHDGRVQVRIDGTARHSAIHLFPVER